MNVAAVDHISTATRYIMSNATYKPISKIHILAMARHAGLAIQDDNAFFLNDLASEKELLAFARLIERAICADGDGPPVAE